VTRPTHWLQWRYHHSESRVQSRYYKQWRRQRSKGARSFRGQQILQPGHPGALFSSPYFLFFVALKTLAANAV